MCMSWPVDHVTSVFHRPGLALAGHWKSVGYAGLSCAFLNSQSPRVPRRVHLAALPDSYADYR